MSDRFPAQMTIGGDLTELYLAELIQAVEMEGARIELGGDVEAETNIEQSIREAVTAGQPIRLYDPEASYGRFEDLEQFCQANGLTFRRHSMAWFEHEAEFSCWTAGMSEPRSVPADQSGNRVSIPLEELEDALGEGQTLADVIAANNFAIEEIPPLRLVKAIC